MSSSFVTLFQKIGPLVEWHHASFCALCWLAAQEKPVNKQQLAAELHVSEPGAWQLLRNLCSRGLVKREKPTAEPRQGSGQPFHLYSLHPEKFSLFES